MLLESIGNLSQLEMLYLSFNQLTALPERMGDLSMLQIRLTSLQHTIAGLQSITELDLRDNPLVERGGGDTLGWRDLRE